MGCADKADVMLVLDRSGSIGPDMVTLKNAALAFVTALAPSADGVHLGQTSFSSNGSLDTHLTDDVATINTAINALISSGTTNLAEGITLATTELDNPGDGDDRADGESKDYMVIITDGAPNVPDEATAQAAGIVAANAAKADGIEIFVVGVGAGISPTTAAYLRDNIATDADHYYAATEFSDLSAVLDAIADCEDTDNDGNPPPPPPPPPPDPQTITIFSDQFGEASLDSTWIKSCPTGTSGCSASDVFLATTSPRSVGDQYLDIQDDAAITGTFSTVGLNNIQLTYYRRVDGLEPGEALVAEWHLGSVASDPWIELEAVGPSATVWDDQVWSLPASADNQAAIQVRFHTVANGDSDDGLIDDFRIVGQS